MSLISFKSANATVQPPGTCAPRYVRRTGDGVEDDARRMLTTSIDSSLFLLRTPYVDGCIRYAATHNHIYICVYIAMLILYYIRIPRRTARCAS